MAYNKIKLMKTEEIKTNIQNSIKAFNSGNLTQNGLDFFSNLGYNTQRNAPLVYPTYEDFQNSFIVEQKFDKTKAKIDEWKYVDLLFQLSKEEISQQVSLFDTQQVDKTIIETYLFFVIELSKEDYTRTELSNITREINRLFPMPVMVLFKYGKKLTLSVINRRLHKRDDSKDVLEKVTLIKDIAIDNPIRAHIEILYDLTFQELYDKFHFTNFVELHNAWQKTLDTKELNKRFYNELFNWYLWAVEKVRFPNDVNDDKDDKVYNAESVIRLLTRLIFVWFIKEKRLVPETLFNLTNLKSILKDFNPHSENSSIFYRAILQNLFFATLNTPMDRDINDDNKNEKRRFINTLPKVGNDQYLDQTKYRYQDYFIYPEKALELFSNIPFLNGGLFECLDFREGNKEIRYDGFSSTESKQAFVADRLFFADEFDIDLNTEYGTKGKKFKVEGLIKILDSYKFTITENTPLEEEIALDPELLGKVFENLLASYNPETKTTARKQTGSFYTPREIVNYMVDESLLAYFKQKLDNSDDTEVRLRDLFAHSYNLPEFSTTEKEIIIKSISDVKILDPACGSGAFPMGVLHRLVDLLNKLDPENKGWNDIQIQRAISETTEVYKHESDSEERRIRLTEIEKAFDLNINNPDYARKLFLIENCIYGVDIQQIAIQISKLRFFISLIVDQKVNETKPNRNILSMPNLETKFVAANTLIGLDKPQQMTLMAGDVERLENELASIRHTIFFTRKYSAKKELKTKEKGKREELKQALIDSGFGEGTASQIAGWNPFDPMQSAKFFDPETMFGFKDGFDVVIGNPPYIGHKGGLKGMFRELKETPLGKRFNNERMDIFYYFFHVSMDFLNNKGINAFITTNYYLTADSAVKLRRDIKARAKLFKLLNFNEFKVFESAMGQHSILTFLTKNQSTTSCDIVNISRLGVTDSVLLEKILLKQDSQTTYYTYESDKLFEGDKDYIRLNYGNAKNVQTIDQILEKIKEGKKTLGHFCSISQGIVTGIDKISPKHILRHSEFANYKDSGVFVLSSSEKKSIGKSSLLKPWFKNSDIIRYYVNEVPEKWLIHTSTEINLDDYENIATHLLFFKKLILERNYESGELTKAKRLKRWWALSSSRWEFDFDKPKIVSPQRSYINTFAYTEKEWYASADVYFISDKLKEMPLKYYLGILNSKLIFFWLYNRGKRKGDMLELYLTPLSEIPIPNDKNIYSSKIVELVENIIKKKKENSKLDTSSLESQIDEMVYKLYELTEEEIRIVEGKV